MVRAVLHAAAAAVLLVVALGACGRFAPAGHAMSSESDAAHPLDTSVDREAIADPEEAGVPANGKIGIYLAGDLKPRSFDDGLIGQTPQDYSIAISRYEIQTALDDPAPVLCFDYGDEYVVADLHQDNLIGHCITATVPSAIYTYGRVRVEWVRYTVTATVHYLGVPDVGKLTLFRAYSDTEHDGTSFKAGEGSVMFSGIVKVKIPMPVGQVPPFPGIKLETIDGEFWMTFPYMRPLPIERSNQQAHWARMNWQIHEAFRWSDVDAPGYADGVWDLGLPPYAGEQVLVPGVTGYYVTSSID